MTFFAVFAARAPAMGSSADRAWQLSQLMEGVLTACNPSYGSLSCVKTNSVSFASVQARKRKIRSLLRRGRRAHRALFPTCSVVRVAGYSVVWDYDPTPIFSLKSTKRSAATILGRSAPSLLFMARFGIFCCRQISLLCFLGYHPILLLSISHLSIFLRNRLNRP